MPRPSQKKAILDAALQVARRPGRLTLDAVAAAAGVSKGGLLYHFPDRDRLLRALVARLVDDFVTQIEHPDDREWARRYVTATAAGVGVGASGALLTVAAEAPDMLAPLRAQIARWHQRAAGVPGLLEVVLAADALWYSQLLGVPVPAVDLSASLEAALA
ncbi:MAG: TetR/AcrR family transcriptional regulator [Myxococcota bacterium]